MLSKCRINAAQKSLQWLRGWVAPNAVYNEFSALQSYSIKWNACDSCQKQSIKCYHPKPTTCDKLREVKRKRNIRPLILITCLQFFNKFSASFVFEPYIIQVLQALGSPINANAASVWTSGIGISGSIFLLLTVKKLGRRKLYLPSILSMAICSIILSSLITFICKKNIVVVKIKFRFEQVFMVSFYSHRVGCHSKRVQMNQQ